MKLGFSLSMSMPFLVLLFGLPAESQPNLLQPIFEFPLWKSIEIEIVKKEQVSKPEKRSEIRQLVGNTKQVISDVLLNTEGILEDGDEQLRDASLYDVHIFEGQMGQIVQVTMTSESFDAFLILQDAFGEEIARNDDGSSGTNAEIVYRLPTTGQYRILANTYDSSGKGEYQLAVSLTDEQTLRELELKAEADTLLNQGIESSQNNQYQDALELLESSLEIYRELGNRQGEAASLGNLGFVYLSLDDFEQSVDFSQQALAIARDIGNRRAESSALGNLGLAYRSSSEYSKAIDFSQQALAVARAIGDRKGEANALGNLGLVYRDLNDYQQAIDSLQKSLLISREIGDRHGEAYTSGNLASTYEILSQYQQAIDFHQQSLTIYKEIGDRKGELNSLGGLGSVYDSLAEYQRAIELYQQSLVIAREIDDRQAEGASIANLGLVYSSLGEYQQAIELYQQSLVIAREIDDRQAEGASIVNLGLVYDSLGKYQQAIELYQQSLAIAKEIGSRTGEAVSLGSLGLAYFRLGEYQKAIDFHMQSLAIRQEIGDRQGEGISLGNLGLVYDSINIGDYQQAVELYYEALAISREIGDRQAEASLLGNLGNAFRRLGEYQRSVNFNQQSLALAREINDRPSEALSLNNLGLSYLSQESNALAEDSLFEAISVFERLRASELQNQDQISLFETQISAYQNLEDALIEQNKFETALEISERGRARAFVQLLSERLSFGSENQDLLQSLRFSEIQRIAREQQSVLVEYAISSSVSGNDLSLYIWLVQPTGELHFREVPLDKKLTGIDELIEKTRSTMGVQGRGGLVLPNFEGDSAEQLRRLYQLLIQPIEDLLPTDPDQRVVFIPQRELFLVPFPALKDSSDIHLIEKHTILTAPSIQVLDLTHRQASAASHSNSLTDILAVGNPTMPEVWIPAEGTFSQLQSLSGAEQEAKAVANFFSSEALIGAQATEQAVKQEIGNARIVHLATHGLLEYGVPEESGIRDIPGAIALTPTQNEDGLLTSTEILDLDLQADLVVLSACDTGLGTITGDGVIGLSRSLIAAGAPSVIVSLWAIPDAPTAELMTEFYRQRQQGKDKAQALRQAMLITMQTHPNPRDWAAFTLIGEAE